MFAKYVYPLWGIRDFTSLRRSDIAALLDHVEDHHGARQADYVLAVVRQIAIGTAAGNDDYLSPFVRGMRRATPNKRERILDDSELRKVWKSAEDAGTFGAIVRLLLLTAQRRDRLPRCVGPISMATFGICRWRSAPRASAAISSCRRSRWTSSMRSLASRRTHTCSPVAAPGRSTDSRKDKARFDKTGGVEGWVLHDLRRTARSLMSRAGVSSEHAERVMGHVIPGVEGIYDRHAYFDEKADRARQAGGADREHRPRQTQR